MSDTNGAPHGKEYSAKRGFSRFSRNAIELVELQTRLLVLGLKNTSRQLRNSVILALLAAATLLGSMPIALLTLANVLETQAQWHASLALGVATLVGLISSAILFLVAWYVGRQAVSSLGRSREELDRNLQWLKEVLHESSESPGSEQQPKV